MSYFSSCGFGNPISFKHIDDEQITIVESFIRRKVSVKTYQQKEDHFGKLYSNNSEQFEFSPGDRILIKGLVDHVKEKVDGDGINKGLHQFNVGKNEKENQIATSGVAVYKIPNTKTHFLLCKLLSAADRNASRKKNGFRYDSDIKRYASYLRMIAGPLAYETIQKNLEYSLPSLPSTNRYINSSNCHIIDGILRCEELLIYLKERDLPLFVSLSEDATRIQGRVQYDSHTNQLVGLKLPLNELSGMPVPYSFPARNATEICNHFAAENSVSNFLNVIMAQPIALNAKPFCLLAYGSDNSYSTTDVVNRWQHINDELAKLNIKVLTFSSDSDPKYNGAMRQLSRLGYNWGKNNWFSCDYTNAGPFFVQDTVHIGTKLQNFFLRTIWNEKKLPFGKHYINWNHLNFLLTNFGKDKHQLTASVLNPVDRQNFSSVLRMCHPRVIQLLKQHVKGSEATALFLQMTNDIIECFMNQHLTPLQRIRKIWYPLFIFRIWRQFIVKHKEYTLGNNFLTSNCYSCIEINSQSLIWIMASLMDQPELFLPHLYESQPCEAIFRQFRSFTSTYSTVANCSLKEAESRISKIQQQNDIVHETSSHFVYPRLAKLQTKASDTPNGTVELANKIEILNEIEACERDAVATARELGLIGKQKRTTYTCKVPLYNSHSSKKKQERKQIKSNAGRNFVMPNLKNIHLKNFEGELKHNDIDETGPFVDIINGDKRTIVKKTSLCWLLRTECQRLSSDRLQRVQCSTSSQAENKTKVKRTVRPTTCRAYKKINKKKKNY